MKFILIFYLQFLAFSFLYEINLKMPFPFSQIQYFQIFVFKRLEFHFYFLTLQAFCCMKMGFLKCFRFLCQLLLFQQQSFSFIFLIFLIFQFLTLFQIWPLFSQLLQSIIELVLLEALFLFPIFSLKVSRFSFLVH